MEHFVLSNLKELISKRFIRGEVIVSLVPTRNYCYRVVVDNKNGSHSIWTWDNWFRELIFKETIHNYCTYTF